MFSKWLTVLRCDYPSYPPSYIPPPRGRTSALVLSWQPYPALGWPFNRPLSAETLSSQPTNTRPFCRVTGSWDVKHASQKAHDPFIEWLEAESLSSQPTSTRPFIKWLEAEMLSIQPKSTRPFYRVTGSWDVQRPANKRSFFWCLSAETFSGQQQTILFLVSVSWDVQRPATNNLFSGVCQCLSVEETLSTQQ